MTTVTHWAIAYIGLPWEYGKEGPDSFDCWGFIRTVQRDRFGVDMPLVDVPQSWSQAHAMIEGHDERRNWERVAVPREGDLVLMARNRLPVHIGIVITANGKLGVLHCMQHSGVVFNTMPSLVGCGWGALTYYRRAACLQPAS